MQVRVQTCLALNCSDRRTIRSKMFEFVCVSLFEVVALFRTPPCTKTCRGILGQPLLNLESRGRHRCTTVAGTLRITGIHYGNLIISVIL